MNGNAAAYLGGPFQQHYGPAAGPIITLITVSPPCPTFPAICSCFCPTSPPQCLDWNPHTILRTYAGPHCPIPGQNPQIPDFPSVACGPQPQLAAMAAQADCKTVMWTAGCTFAGAQQGTADCKNVMWTAGCTFAGAQQQGTADCKNVMWTAGCTFAGAPPEAARITLRTIATQCWNNPTLATHCFICPPLGHGGFPPPPTVLCPPDPCCKPVLGTVLCTVVPSKFPDTNARGFAAAADCKHVLWTAGCTFAGQQAGSANECGNVLTTLVCTLAKAGDTPNSPLCITVLTHVPTWCAPDSNSADCKHVLWTAGCTFAGADRSQECGNVLTTLACTLAAQGKVGAEQCGNVLTTLACTLSKAQLPQGEGGELGCKDVLWTAGCTFDGLAKGERCGDVLTTLACTLVAAPAEGSNDADCKHVLWTAGCTFAAQPSERDAGCKVVAWTAGCTF